MLNLELKILILKSGKKHYELAHELRWHPSKLSTILNGVYKASSMEKENLCEALGCEVEQAFPSGEKEYA